MSRIVVAAAAVAGHANPLIEIAAGLHRLGHDVTVLTGIGFESAVRKHGVRFVPLPPAGETNGGGDYFERKAALPPGLDRLNFDLANGFGATIPAQHAALQALMAEGEKNFLVYDAFFLGAWPVLLGAPGIRPARAIGVGISPLQLASDDTTGMGPAPGGPDESRRANRAANARLRNMLAPGQSGIEVNVRACGADGEIPFLFDGVVTVPDAFAELTIAEFEFVRSDAPPGLHFVGPIRAAPPIEGTQAPGWLAGVPEDRPVVAVTQGTIANQDLTALIEPALQSLATRNVHVVVALGGQPASVLSNVPDNCVVQEYIDFGQLLPHVDVFVTNGGFGGVQQALAAGVPLVVSGSSEDKPAVAARVAHTGAGIDLHSDAGNDRVGEAVDTILGDSVYRETARRMAELIADTDPAAAIDALLFTPRGPRGVA
jgi:UDP:flavonoid glycosyltransferase YjiC (YdhE family)